MTENIVFNMGSYTVNLEIRGNITVVHGDSATGKTLICKWLSQIKNLPEYNDKFDNIMLYSHKNPDLRNITEMKGKLNIIDNVDILLVNNPRLVDFIAMDTNNKYLIMARGGHDFGVSPNYFATLQVIDNHFSLNYRYSVPEWFLETEMTTN